MKKYFEKPTQVKFIDCFESEKRILGGIAFGDIIICGECGSTIEMDDIEWLEELPWVSISEEIKGD